MRGFVLARPATRFMGALVLLTMLLGLMVGPQLPPARADTPPAMVQVTLTIDAVDALDCFDTDVFGCNAADFYPLVTINNGAEQTKPNISDNDHPRPTDWVFTSDDIPFVSGATIPITIAIRDSDGTFRGEDDHVDVSPRTGDTGLKLNVTLGNVPCSVTDTGVDGTCGLPIVTTGTGDDNNGRASLTFRVDVHASPSQADGDGDGIPDDWETNGVTLNGHFIDLPSMGADPNKPDLFIQLDWMQDATHDQRLSDAAIKQVVDAFANQGINLHVDEGPNSTLDYAAGTKWGSLSAAQQTTWQANLGSLDVNGDYDWTDFQQIKDTDFIPTGRSPIFHYALAANLQQAPAIGETQTTSSGISRNSSGSGFDAGTSDFLITLGGFDKGVGSQPQQAGTLMHEFGHNLGLHHGGNVDTNYKSNYPSIMNYLFQMSGVLLNDGLGTFQVDYSHGTQPDIEEQHLPEGGLGSGFGTFGIGSRCPDSTMTPPYKTVLQFDGAGPYDWNCDGDTSDGSVSYDANSSGSVDSGSFSDFNDWASLKFLVGAIGDFGVGNLPLTSPPEPAVTSDTQAPTTTASLSGTLGQNGWYVSAVTVSLSAVDAGGSGVLQTRYRINGGSWTVYQTPFPVASEGANSVEFYSMDTVGNVEDTQSVTVKIDVTPPTVACVASPASLAPSNHKLVAVTASVSVTDAGSGPAGYTLIAVGSNEPDNGLGDGDMPNDIQGFTLGTPDTTGQLRAERSGAGSGRIYTLTYLGTDQAGNSASCGSAVKVAH